MAAIAATIVSTQAEIWPVTNNPAPAIRLSWYPSTSHGVTNYDVLVGTNYGHYQWQYRMGTNLSLTLTNLERGVTINYAYICQANGLNSSLSPERTYTPLMAPEPPIERPMVIITAQSRALDSWLWCDLGDFALSPEDTNSIYRLRIARVP